MYFIKTPDFLKYGFPNISNKNTWTFKEFKQLNCSPTKIPQKGKQKPKAKEDYLEKGKDKLSKDLDIIHIVDSIYKFRATLRVLVKNDKSIINQIKKSYFNDKSLKPIQKNNKEYDKFLDQDELFELNQEV